MITNLINFKSNNEQKDLWNNASKSWSKTKNNGGSVYQKEVITKEFLDVIGDVKNKKVLDLGCGEGIYSRLLSEKGANVTGVDISDEQIKAARNNSNSCNSVNYICSASSNLKGLKDNSFDKVVSVMLTMYLNKDDFNKTLKEVHRVLKPNGEFIILTRHPFTTRKSNKDSSIKQEFTTSYFSDEPYTHLMKLDDKEISVKYHPRTISAFLNALVNQGFEVKKLNEPMPSKELVLQYNNLSKFAYNPSLLTIKAIDKSNRQ